MFANVAFPAPFHVYALGPMWLLIGAAIVLEAAVLGWVWRSRLHPLLVLLMVAVANVVSSYAGAGISLFLPMPPGMNPRDWYGFGDEPLTTGFKVAVTVSVFGAYALSVLLETGVYLVVKRLRQGPVWRHVAFANIPSYILCAIVLLTELRQYEAWVSGR